MKYQFLAIGQVALRFIENRAFVCLCFLLLSASTIFAQSQAQPKRLDSLLNLNQVNNKLDSSKLKILSQIYKEYIRLRNVEKVDEFVDQTLQLAQKTNLREYSMEAYYRRGLFSSGFNLYQKAEENYLNALKEAFVLKNLKQTADCYLSLGSLYMSIPDYAKALEMNQKAINIFQKSGKESDLARCYSNLANVYQDLGEQAKSLEYLKMALKVFSKEGSDFRRIALVNQRMGLAYFNASKDELDKMNISINQRLLLALDHFNHSLKEAEAIEDKNIVARSIKGIGNVYFEMGEKNLALNSYQRAIQISKERDDKRDYADCLYALGDFYQQEKDYDNAIVLFSNSFKAAEENNLLDIKRNSAQALSDVYERLGDFDKSLVYYKEYIAAKDDIFNSEKEKEITRRQMQIDFDIKEKDYLFKQKITNIELQKQVLLARQQQQLLILRKQELALSDKEKSLQRLTFLKKQAALESDRKLQRSNYQRAKLEAQYATSLMDKQIAKQEQQIKFDWKVKIFLTVAITLVLLTSVIVFFNQRKTTRLNKIINKQKRELEQLSRVKDRIFSVVSHDMRMPLNSLISFIQMLEGGNIEQERLNRYAASLKNNLTYTSTMMENLLNWAASQMQGFNPLLEELDIHELTTEVINSLKEGAEEKKIILQNHLLKGTHCRADANMLSLVIRNLVSNAIKFTPESGVISIAAESIDKVLHITVTDTGIGISPQQIRHFNKRGYLGAGVSTLGTNKEKGTGLGLLLCRTFIDLMDGQIKINAEREVGTEFILTLKQGPNERVHTIS